MAMMMAPLMIMGTREGRREWWVGEDDRGYGIEGICRLMREERVMAASRLLCLHLRMSSPLLLLLLRLLLHLPGLQRELYLLRRSCRTLRFCFGMGFGFRFRFDGDGWNGCSRTFWDYGFNDGRRWWGR